MTFLAAGIGIVGGQCTAIRFYWSDCEDNLLSDAAGAALGSANIAEADDPTPINDPFDNLPTFLGMPESCIDPGALIPLIRQIDYTNGMFCFSSVACHCINGDINVNGLSYEIADAVMFTNYFVSGFDAFDDHIDESIATSDVNRDGEALSIADLVYMIRVIVGDALALPSVRSISSNFSFEDNVFSIESVELGGAHIVVTGNTTPILLTEGMDLAYGYDESKDLTNIVVTSPLDIGEEIKGFTGDFLRVTGELAQPPSFATVEGNPVELNLIPRTFKLSQNYPNPFNPSTVISMSFSKRSDYRLTIFNVNGQTVDVFSGISDAGILDIAWDASELSSGVYFYRMEAGDFVATKKAILLK